MDNFLYVKVFTLDYLKLLDNKSSLLDNQGKVTQLGDTLKKKKTLSLSLSCNHSNFVPFL